MARQRGSKRARTQPETHKNAFDDENNSVDGQDVHTAKKTVRWENGTDANTVDDQDNSDDDSGGSQKVSSESSMSISQVARRGC